LHKNRAYSRASFTSGRYAAQCSRAISKP